MKKIAFCLVSICLTLTFFPSESNAQSNDATLSASSSVIVSKNIETTVAKVKVLELRLSEINAMDKSNLTWTDKRNLRKEVRSIKGQLNEMGGGVYISTGVLVLIVILLIIFW